MAIGAINSTVISRVVTRHHHLGPLRKLDGSGHISGPEIELGSIPGEERVVTPPLLFGQHIDLSLEIGVRSDGPRLGQHLAPLHIIFTHPPQQNPDIVPGPTLIQQFAEHFDPGSHRLMSGTDPHDLHFLIHLQNPLLHPPGHHRPPPGDTEHILDRHQERLLSIPIRLRDIRIHRLHQLHDLIRRSLPSPSNAFNALPAPPGPHPQETRTR